MGDTDFYRSRFEYGFGNPTPHYWVAKSAKIIEHRDGSSLGPIPIGVQKLVARDSELIWEDIN